MKIFLLIAYLIISFDSFSQKSNSNNDSIISLFENKLKKVEIRMSKDSSLSGVALVKLPVGRKEKAIILNEIPENYQRFINDIINGDSAKLLSGFKKNTILPVIFLNLHAGISEEEVGLIQSRTLISTISSLSNKRKLIILRPAIIIRPDPSHKRVN